MHLNICRNSLFSSALILFSCAVAPQAWAQVATPVISPAAGSITSAQSITITDATQGATIYYAAFGSNSTSGYIEYTGPIPMEGSGQLTIQAYATETGQQQSSIASANYTLNFPAAAATPVISLASGSYATAQTLTISDTTPGAIIHYSTVGNPYDHSVYSGEVTVSTSEIVTALAIAPGLSESSIATAQYYIDNSMSRFIYTIAGNSTPGYYGDGGPATLAEIDSPNGVAVDSYGNVYFADTANNVVRKVNANTGIITTIAGTGVSGHFGDGEPATRAQLWSPFYLAVDPTGNIFILETGDEVVRRIDAVTGVITTFAGNPAGTFNPGGPANNFYLGYVTGIACDSLGNLYIADYGEVLKVTAASGNITEIVNFNTGTKFYGLNGITVDRNQNIYVSDFNNNAVWKIYSNGAFYLFAGGNQGSFSGDGGLATQAALEDPFGLAVDGSGNVYISDSLNGVIREVNTSGIINTVAGSLYGGGYGGDGSPALDASFYFSTSIAADSTGNIYVADPDYKIRQITVPSLPPTAIAATPILSLAPGSYPDSQVLTMSDDTFGAEIYLSLDGTAPTTKSQGYHGPIEINGTVTVKAIAVAPGYLASPPVSATYTITTPPSSVISTIAGNGQSGFSGFGGPAISASIGQPQAVAFDGNGNLYIADTENNVVWMMAAATGNISVIAGTGASGDGADGGLATATELSYPRGIAFDKFGNLYIADSNNGRIRMVAAATGIITTVAGPGAWSSTLGDGGLATSAHLAGPSGLAFDGAGNLYIADTNDNRVRMVAAASGIITTVAGGGYQGGPLGDGELATAAYVGFPQGITFDSLQNLYIADTGNSRIRKVDKSTGIITTVAGNGITGNTGDGGLATAGEVYLASGIAVDGAGNVYFPNYLSSIRKVDAATGIITTIAGDGYYGFGGDGGAALMAEFNGPAGLALDSAGNLNFADSDNSRIRKVTIPPTAAVLISPTPGLGTTLGAPDATFQWTSVVGASDYQLNLSAIGPGQSELFLYKGTATTATASTLPAHGAEVYATLYTKSNGVWQSNSYVYYESGPRLATLTSPNPEFGILLGVSNVAFQWTTGAEVAEYQLNLSTIGTGQSELFSYKGTATSAVVPNLPANGATVYATLYSKINGVWQSIAYQYTESGTPTPAVLTSPTPGSTTILGTASVLFQWTAGGGATEFQLNLSAITPGASDLFLYKGTGSSVIVPSIPARGVTVYATLYSKIKGTWQSYSYVYTESGSPTPAALTSPTPGVGTILGTSNVLFQWSAGTSASVYQLNLSKVAAGNSELYSYKGTGLSATAPSLPANGVKVYARLYSKIDGIWLYNDYVYTEK